MDHHEQQQHPPSEHHHPHHHRENPDAVSSIAKRKCSDERTPLLHCAGALGFKTTAPTTTTAATSTTAHGCCSTTICNRRYQIRRAQNLPTSVQHHRRPTLGQLFSSLTISNEFNTFLLSQENSSGNAPATSGHNSNNDNSQKLANIVPPLPNVTSEAPFYCLDRSDTSKAKQSSSYRRAQRARVTFAGDLNYMIMRECRLLCRWLVKVILLLAIVTSFILTTVGQTNRFEHYDGHLCAAITLILLYTLLIFELVNRTLASMIGAAMAVTVYTCLRQKPDLQEIVTWADYEILALLFGMMIIVTVLGDTGLFDWLAVVCYAASKGRLWPQLFGMCIICASLSALLDNVSTMLLIAPTMIKLCKLQQMAPQLPLMLMTMFSNIGGAATPIGDPPNLIVFNNPVVQATGLTFAQFTAYCTPIVIVTMMAIMFYCRCVFRARDFDLDLPSIVDIEPNRRRNFDDEDNNNVSISSNNENDDDHHQQVCAMQRKQAEQELDVWRAVKESIAALPSQNTGVGVGAGASNNRDSLSLVERVGRKIDSLERHLLALPSDTVGTGTGKHWSQVDAERYEQFEHVSPTEVFESRVKAIGGHLAGEPITDFERRVSVLRRKHTIRNRPLLTKCLLIVSITMMLFFLQSFPWANLTLGWASLFAGLTILVLTSASGNGGSTKQSTLAKDGPTFESIIERIEWSTLIFFFCLFIVMEVCVKLGLMSAIGEMVRALIETIPNGDGRTLITMSLVLWISGVASAIIDNVPFTVMMIKIIESMEFSMRQQSQDEQQSLPVRAIAISVALGACFGGNATLIGASANLVTASIAERQGHPITFGAFSRYGTPITVLSLVITNFYLWIVFCVLDL